MAEAEKPYKWSQTDAEVTIEVPVAAEVTKANLKLKMEVRSISLMVSGKQICGGEIAGKIQPDDSYWALEGSGADRKLMISLAKKPAKNWKCLWKEEEDALPQASELDDNFDIMALEHDDDDPERVEEQLENEKKLEARYKKLLVEKGLQSEDTLETFFALFDNCIQLYRLNKLSDYLEEVVPECRKRDDKYKLKAIQALAFVRWKQSKFREALPLFHEMEEILGKGAALCENIAHTYNSLGDYNKAEDYFRQSLKFIEQEHGSNHGNRGGVLLGLGLVRDRLGKFKEALPVCQKAYEFYKDRANGAPASLQAKAGISCGKIHAKLGNLVKCEEFIREAVQMYEVTCGETSPLTASAYHELGKCLWAQRKRQGSRDAFKRAYELEGMKDAWDLVVILEIHNELMDTHLKEVESIDRASFQGYYKIVNYVENRVRKELPQDGNAAVYYKAAGEMKAWGGKYEEAKSLFTDAVALLEVETSVDTSGLIQSCKEMLQFCERNMAGTQNTPMTLDVGGAGGGDDGEGPVFEDFEEDDDNVKIEEIFEDVEDGEEPVNGGASASSARADSENIEVRPMQQEDFGSVCGLCIASGKEPALTDEKAFGQHLAGNPGLCWMAEVGLDRRTLGVAVCGSDSTWGSIHQLLADEEEVKVRLLQKCIETFESKSLRFCQAVVPQDEDGSIYEKIGWVSQKVYARPSTSANKRACHAETADSNSGYADANKKAKPVVPRSSDEWKDYDPDKEVYGDDAEVLKNTQRSTPSVVQALKTELEAAEKITKYAWDQSDKFVSVYVDFAGVKSFAEDKVTCTFDTQSVVLLIEDTSGKKFRFAVPNLCKPIDTAASKRTLKTDMVSIKLKKVETGAEWSDLTDDKDKYQERREFRIQHGDLKGASTEELLADMYQNATDEERAGLRDAMAVNRQKREEEKRGR